MKTVFKLLLIALLPASAFAAEPFTPPVITNESTLQQLFPESEAPAATITAPRLSFPVTYTEAEAAISQSIMEKSASGRIGTLMDGRNPRPIFNHSEPLHVQAKGLQLDEKKKRWQANLLLVNEAGEVVSALPAAGVYHEMVEVPVLKRSLRRGELISEADIETREFILSRTRPDTITDKSILIGKTPAHGVSPYRPIREAEITGAPLVKRDAIVQIRYSVPGMEITTTGQALAAGARGDVIEVRNTSSRKIVRGVVENAESVTVIVPHQQTTALTGVNHASF